MTTPPSSPDLNSAEMFLLRFHERYPGCTTRAMAQAKTIDGHSSYDLMAAQCPVGAPVVDLGCGDGYLLEQLVKKGHDPSMLVGIDRSPAEVSLAKGRSSLRGADIRVADGTASGLEEARFGTVLSHLSFMFMRPSTGAVSEIQRILRPGGKCVALVGGGPAFRPANALDIFLDCVSGLWQAYGRVIPHLVQKQATTADGLATLFNDQTGFGDAQTMDEYVGMTGTPAALWPVVSTVYERECIEPDMHQTLRENYLQACADKVDEDGLIRCDYFIQIFSARRVTTITR
jgi:SAM-dependent methyltransferase